MDLGAWDPLWAAVWPCTACSLIIFELLLLGHLSGRLSWIWLHVCLHFVQSSRLPLPKHIYFKILTLVCHGSSFMSQYFICLSLFTLVVPLGTRVHSVVPTCAYICSMQKISPSSRQHTLQDLLLELPSLCLPCVRNTLSPFQLLERALIWVGNISVLLNAECHFMNVQIQLHQARPDVLPSRYIQPMLMELPILYGLSSAFVLEDCNEISFILWPVFQI